ncbi:HNH endonuclease [Micromonospora aurantiaca (nom. illeg.)]|uniref:HNH endonuclease n=1 Tax=Micromonospora aurantiaca (nom. illeg.) TaxID=47850 RepID=UPI003F4A0DF5
MCRGCRAVRRARPSGPRHRPSGRAVARAWKPRPCRDCGTPSNRRGNIPLCESCAADRRRARSRTKCHRRRAASSLTDITPAYERSLRAQSRHCAIPECAATLSDAPMQDNSKELDHIVPLNAGGTHTVGNVRIICRRCNRTRPKDGSDYVGQLTLWAYAPHLHAIPVPVTIAKDEARKRLVQCQCGRARLRSSSVPCPTCRGLRAYDLRKQGRKWRDVAKAMGYASPGAAHNSAHAALRYVDSLGAGELPTPHPGVLFFSPGCPVDPDLIGGISS